MSESEEEAYIHLTNPQAVRGKLDNQDYKEITAKVLRTGKLFEDPMVRLNVLFRNFTFIIHLNFLQFKPNKYSISFTGKLDNGEDASFKWIRARDLFRDPQMLKHGHSKRDVNQGEVYFF